MEKGYEIVNDTKLDSRASRGNATADYGGDLAKNEGVDLNADSEASNMSKTLERSTGQRIAAGFFTLPAMAGSGTSETPNEHVRDIMNEPIAAHHQVYEGPESESTLAQSLEHFGQTGEAPTLQIDGKDYDDGRFNPDAQTEAAELDNALNQPIAADHTDPPYADVDESNTIQTDSENADGLENPEEEDMLSDNSIEEPDESSETMSDSDDKEDVEMLEADISTDSEDTTALEQPAFETPTEDMNIGTEEFSESPTESPEVVESPDIDTSSGEDE